MDLWVNIELKRKNAIFGYNWVSSVINGIGCVIELGILNFAHYEMEWWSWIYKSLTFENVNYISVEAFIICLEITALGYR